MTKPKLSTKTPDATEHNALIALHGQVIALPRERRYAVVELAVKDIRTDVATGDEQATLQIVHIEVPSGKGRDEIEKLIDSEFTRRTNQKTRPNPHEDDVNDDTPLTGIDDLGDGN